MKLFLIIFWFILIQGCIESKNTENIDLFLQFEREKSTLNDIVENIKLDTLNNFKTGIVDLGAGLPKPVKGRVLLLKSDTVVTAMFYLNKNNLKSTSLVYTNDPEKIIEIEEKIRTQSNNLKLDKNWYLVIP